ncbi:hypothetical protein HELRODRAFT_88074 [Helobdella robusta]|uniref:Dynein regulatory complex subunit 5 n=1 Tax=Helobdella robusta TaxID=6412 RepID=T1G6Y1_HELRO|nr:hypothetical protein HELRODRAFT_88074 [Helobdella robusta]ESN93843.1 hypothetical protein HELRODRAFT_88074 [Helobdella robusta]
MQTKQSLLKQAEIDKLNLDLEQKQDVSADNDVNKKIGRNIVAEDFRYNLPKIPTLVDLCLSHMIEEFIIHRNTFKKVPEKFRKKITSQLSVDVPLWVTTDVVKDDEYWKRKCRARWRTSDSKEHRNSWKATYMEMNMQETLEQFVPSVSDLNDLIELINISSKFIRKLNVQQLLPKPSKQSDKMMKDDSDEDYERLDFTEILPKLKRLESISLQYLVRNCGMNFKWGHFKMSEKDCTSLAKSLYFCKSLMDISIVKSSIDDAQTEILCSQLKDHPNLSTLNLSHNSISDKGMSTISTSLLNKHSFVRVQSIDLTNNSIKYAGVKVLAKELETNDKLLKLQLRMNKIGDEGGSLILIAMARNKTLNFLGLGSCDLGDMSAEAICYILKNNRTLQYLDISCNVFGTDNGEAIRQAVEGNDTLLNVDVRETEVTKEAEYFIAMKHQLNQERNGNVASDSHF